MIKSSNTVKFCALGLALTAHAAFGLRFTGPQEVAIKGSAGSTMPVLGNSFADMTTNTPEPVTPPDVTEAEPPTEGTPPVREAMPVTRPVPTLAVTPSADVIAALPQTPVIADAVPVVPAQPERAATVEAQEPDTSLVTRSARPSVRDRAVEERNIEQARKEAAPKPKPKPVAPEPTPAPAQREATRGSATGKAEERATSQGGGTRNSSAQGNAAASNYPGQVMRKISRVSKPRVGVRGSAMVRFSIAGNGGLSAVDIARSSGDQRIDQAALKIIRRASPFPPPPMGARKSFQLEINVR
ncbi:MAG: TonB family protein [Pseudomonadota bacterium]